MLRRARQGTRERREMKRFAVLAAAAALAAAMPAFGQAGTGFSIFDGDAWFGITDSPTSGTATSPPTAVFRVNGATGTNHLFANWWWFRTPGDTREYAFHNASGTTGGGNTATTTWHLVGRGAVGNPYAFSAALTYTVTDTGDNLGQLVQSMVITNIGSEPMTLNLFNYADFDVNASSGGDSATGGLDGITITDGPWTILYQGVGASGYRVTPYAGLLGELTDASATNFSNTGLPFGPSDITAGFQWTLNLDAGQSATVVMSFAVVPTPASLALLGLGVLTAARRRR